MAARNLVNNALLTRQRVRFEVIEENGVWIKSGLHKYVWEYKTNFLNYLSLNFEERLEFDGHMIDSLHFVFQSDFRGALDQWLGKYGSVVVGRFID